MHNIDEPSTQTMCPSCRAFVTEEEKKLIKAYKIPFVCKQCGGIKFPFQALNGVVFVWPKPIPDSQGKLMIPENIREQFKTSLGVILSAGKGVVEKKSEVFITCELEQGDIVLYDSGVPWKRKVPAPDGKEYDVVMANMLDINAKVLEIENELS